MSDNRSCVNYTHLHGQAIPSTQREDIAADGQDTPVVIGDVRAVRLQRL